MKKIAALLKPSKKDVRVLRYLSDEEIKKINDEFALSNFYILKKKIKSILIKFIRTLNLSKIIKLTNPRSIENVHHKYENIAGQYIKSFKTQKNLTFIGIDENDKVSKCKGMITPYYGESLKRLYSFYKCRSVLEVGAGELTTLYTFYKKLKTKPKNIGAVDLSFKRLKAGNKFFKKQIRNLNFMARADASELPFKSNSFDMVYTTNCLEQIPELFLKSLKEIVRVSGNLIVIIEPSFQFGTNASKNNLIKKGYTKINKKYFEELGLKPVYRGAMNFSYYTTRTEIIILQKKNIKIREIKANFMCPVNKIKLEKKNNFMSDKNNKILYKVKDSIPLLCRSDIL